MLIRVIKFMLWRNVFSFYLTIGIPVIYIIGLIAVARPNSLVFVSSLRLVCLLVAMVGMLVWVWSYISLGKYFGVLPEKHERTKRGLYKYLQHPMYVGIMLTYFGLSVANQSRAGIIFTVFLLGPLLFLRSKLEERKLW